MSAAILATSETLRAILLDAMVADPVLRAAFPPLGASVVSLASPDGMVGADEAGVSLWLYQVIRDPHLLNRPPRPLPPDAVEARPLPVRLRYLVTPMMRGAGGVAAPETDQHVLGRILQALDDRPIATGSDLRDTLVGTDRTLIARMETPGLEEIARIWDTLDEAFRPSICYEVGPVDIVARLGDARGPLVRRSEPDTRVATPAPAVEVP